MQHPTHPDDERLAALAGGDPEVTSDGALRAHVDSCDRCAETVRGSARCVLPWRAAGPRPVTAAAASAARRRAAGTGA